MATTAVCVNAECPEHEIVKAMGVTLHPDEQVMCGACRQPCELRGDPPERFAA